MKEQRLVFYIVPSVLVLVTYIYKKKRGPSVMRCVGELMSKRQKFKNTH